ncbi:MAG TPA: Lrp/AsnC family transcriptional regulator [Planctomycetota bacterium]|jgi:DNA-binding Lrp family transcriptional regulator|nr:ArsR family transcriptional regulator [Planctomycetota bacterium]MDP6128916.1 Lrp/AsnC family transcriptional regulator [Planctomycetota bacterium]MDP7245087.1 Lrp/AsnC family transcriptional regulator [Planctomycetota bacterium]MDP7559133.1 Lrp/AsnC family transcriptional regulator [Planctomycetota bacterium]HJM40337.1 Lrp/AsnC family transcriptional regulator [Planctomycetota bacterium]|tara:strand:+ start:13670 stop:14131 length:462 start_codon:yes stop_codon:yes gene_type:complete
MDRIESCILAELQNNARLSNKELAGRVGLSPSSCLERVRRLTERGVIRGAHVEVDPSALGITLQAFVGIRLRKHSKAEILGFHDYLLCLPEVIALWHVSGDHDYLVQVAVRDSDHLRDVALDSLTSRPEVEHLETSLIFEYQRKFALPDLQGE